MFDWIAVGVVLYLILRSRASQAGFAPILAGSPLSVLPTASAAAPTSLIDGSETEANDAPTPTPSGSSPVALAPPAYATPILHASGGGANRSALWFTPQFQAPKYTSMEDVVD